MLKNNKAMSAVFLCLIIWVLTSCATSELKIEPISTSENPIDHINRLDDDVGNARNNQVNVLAPTSFAAAETALNGAKKELEQGGELSDILDKIAYGRAQLKSAEEMAELARTTLPDTIKARDMARSAGATNFEKDYSELEEQFIGLTRAIEDNNLKYAQRNRAKVAEAFDGLELRAIKEQTIGVARDLIREGEGLQNRTPII